MPETLAEVLILEALRDEASRRPPTRVLLIGMQSPATVGAANQIVGSERVTLLHLDRATGAVDCGHGNRELFLGDESGAAGQPGDLGPFSVVAVNVDAAKSYRLLREILHHTAHQVDADGAVLVAGPRKGGAEVAARALEEVFESVVLGTYRKGQRIYRATSLRPPSSVAGDPTSGAPGLDAGGSTAETTQEIETVSLRGQELRLLLDDRIFARGRLDPATRMLAEAFEVRLDAAVLDLGAGNGVLGILAALMEPSSQAWLVDSDPLAVQASRKNAELNGASNVSVHLSDVLRDLPDLRFDLVLMNPPFHRGRVHDAAIAERFIAEGSGALRPGGVIYVVCNRFLRYEPVLQRLVGPVREAVGDRHFKVLVARRSTNARRQSGQNGGRDARARRRRPE